MRTIKFRGKRKDNGEWIYGFYALINYCHCIIQNDAQAELAASMGHKLNRFVEVAPATVGQFIDRKTIEGMELFEGDVVQDNSEKHKVKIGVIIWDCIKAAFVIRGNGFYDMALGRQRGFYRISWGEKFSWWKLKRIGNIHDNPALLQKKENEYENR